MSYLKSVPSNLSSCKTTRQFVLFGYFWDKLLKNYCHIWNQHPQVCQNLIQWILGGIGSTFSKGPAPGSGLGPGTPISINQAVYEHLRLRNSKTQILIFSKSAAFQGFQRDVFFRPSLMQFWKALDLGLLQKLRWNYLTKLPCVWVFWKGGRMYW